MRGFNDPAKQVDIVNRVYRLNISLVAFLETRVKENNSSLIVQKHFAN